MIMFSFHEAEAEDKVKVINVTSLMTYLQSSLIRKWGC